MVMAAESHLSLVIEARDMASARMRGVGNEVGFLEKQVSRTALSFVRFTSILGAAGISVYTLVNIVKSQIANMEATTRAATTFTSQLRFLGFGAEDAAGSVGALRNALNSTAFQALPGLDAPLKKFAAQLGPDSLKRIDDLSKKFSWAFGVNMKTAVIAVTEAMAGNIEPLSKITGSTADLAEQAALVDKIVQEAVGSIVDVGDPLVWWTLPVLAWKGFLEPFKIFFTELLPNWSVQLWTQGQGLGIQMISGIWAGIDFMKGFFSTAFPNFFTDQLPAFGVWLWTQAQGLGIQIVSGIWAGVDFMKTFFTATFPTFLTDQLPAFLGQMFDKGKSLGESLAVGIWAGVDFMKKWFTTTFPTFLTEQLPSFLADMFNKGKSLGAGLATGIWSGIDSLSASIWAKAWAFAVGIYNSIKRGLADLWPFSSAPPTSPSPVPSSPTPPSFTAPSSPTPSPGVGGWNQSAILDVQLMVDRDKLGSVMLEVVNDQVRLLEPNVGLR